VNALALLDQVETLFDPASAPDDLNLVNRFDDFTHDVGLDALAQSERMARFPREELLAFAKAGLMDEIAPECAGGKLEWARAMRLATRGAAWDLDFMLCLGGAVLGGASVLVAGNRNQQQAYFGALLRGEIGALALSEWDRGSDLLNNECVATREGDSFVLRGVKGPINGGSLGSYVIVLARTRDPSDASSQTLFLLDRRTEGISADHPFPSIGYRNMDLARVTLNDVHVPASAVLGQVGEGFLQVRRTLEISRSGVAAMTCGALATTAALAVEHARARQLYHAPIANLPSVRTLVARCVARLALGTALVRTAVHAVGRWAGSARDWTCAAKWMLPVLLERNVHDAGTVLGARSLMEDLPLARLRRSAPLLAIFDGSALLQLDELFRYVTFWEKRTVDRRAAREALFAKAASPFDAHRTDDDGVLSALSPLNGDGPFARIAEAIVPFARDARRNVHLRGPVSEIAAWLYAVNALDYGQSRFPDAVRSLALHEAEVAMIEPCSRLGIATGELLTGAPRFSDAVDGTFAWVGPA
jgi:alkylation response protein AidB-like acyl-CoA dehydrogenase